MRTRRLRLTNLRSIAEGEVVFPDHTVIIGGNNVGMSTLCEALDLVAPADLGAAFRGGEPARPPEGLVALPVLETDRAPHPVDADDGPLVAHRDAEGLLGAIEYHRVADRVVGRDGHLGAGHPVRVPRPRPRRPGCRGSSRRSRRAAAATWPRSSLSTCET